MEDITEKSGEIGKIVHKGTVADGIIIRITDGIASDFMTPEQISGRMAKGEDPYTEIEIGIPDYGVILKPFSFLDYTRIGKGIIPANSRMGKILAVAPLKVDNVVNMIAKEINNVKNGEPQSFITWDIIY